MKKVFGILIAASLFVGLFALPVEAAGIWDVCPEGVQNSSAICGDESEATDVVKRVINLFIFAIGALSVIMIIHSGLKYTASRGDAEAVKGAKNTLLYAVTGLIVALLAFSIVNFVLGSFSGPQSDNSNLPPASDQPPARSGNT